MNQADHRAARNRGDSSSDIAIEPMAVAACLPINPAYGVKRPAAGQHGYGAQFLIAYLVLGGHARS